MVLRGCVAAVGVLALASAGCATDSAAGADPAAAATVIATTSIWADITANVLCDQPVGTLVPAGADPHTFEPSLRDRQLIAGARLVVANGAGLEAGSSDLLAAAARVHEATSSVDLIDGDPHVWQDPRRVAQTAAAIAEAAEAAGLDACPQAYVAELERLDDEIANLTRSIPAASRSMVTSHDALGYFADRYGLEIIGTVIPATNTLAETNARDLAALAELIDHRGVPAIFTEELESTADADALAERLGVAVVPLVTDTLTTDPATDTYLEMMRWNAARIAEALTP